MVSDRSPDFEGTWDFLDRRMSDIGMLISAKATVSVHVFVHGNLLQCDYCYHWVTQTKLVNQIAGQEQRISTKAASRRQTTVKPQNFGTIHCSYQNVI